MNGRLCSDLETRIAAVLARFPQVRAVWLFGSVAQGRAREASDIDVAVVVDSSAAFPLWEAHTALVTAGLDRVDLAVLGERDLVLRFEAVRQNRLLFARADFPRGEYFSQTVREFFGLSRVFRTQREALRRRYGATRDRSTPARSP